MSIGKTTIFFIQCRYNPRTYYESNAELKRALDQIKSGFFSPDDPNLFTGMIDGLLNHDTYVMTRKGLIINDEKFIIFVDTVCWLIMNRTLNAKKKFQRFLW